MLYINQVNSIVSQIKKKKNYYAENGKQKSDYSQYLE